MNDETRLPWFPCEPSKLLGALASMKPHVGYTYWIVCLRCYEVGGPCPDSLDAIARRTGYNKRVVSDALDVLFRMEKLVRVPDGISNPYAAQVLEGMKVRRSRLSRSGKEGAKRKWGKTQENQTGEDGEAIESPMAFDAELDLQVEVERKERVEARPKRRAPRAMIRPDWSPSEVDLAFADGHGFDRPEVLGTIAPAFVNHHRSRGTLIADLAATWRTWITNEVKFRARRQGGPSARAGNGPSMFDIAAGHHREGAR